MFSRKHDKILNFTFAKILSLQTFPQTKFSPYSSFTRGQALLSFPLSLSSPPPSPSPPFNSVYYPPIVQLKKKIKSFSHEQNKIHGIKTALVYCQVFNYSPGRMCAFFLFLLLFLWEQVVTGIIWHRHFATIGIKTNSIKNIF